MMLPVRTIVSAFLVTLLGFSFAPSWGYQHFSSVKVIVGGVTIDLTAPDADAQGMIPHAENPVGTPVPWALSGFKSVALAASGHAVNFDAKQFSSGVYFYRLEAGEFKAQKRMLFVK